jgi:hypothetical protein
LETLRRLTLVGRVPKDLLLVIEGRLAAEVHGK